MSRNLLAVLGLAVLAGCAGGERSDTAAADSLNRDLQLAPVDTSAELNDRPDATTTPPPVATTPAPRTTTPRTTTPPRSTTPRTTTPAAPAAPAARTLAAGTTISATTNVEAASNKNKVGDIITASVASDVKDSRGRTVIPAGSTVNMRITALKESENKSDNTGTFTLAVSSVEVNGETHNIDGSISGVQTSLRDRGTNVGDAAKVGAGAAAGAVVGRVLGGSTKGAVIGGVIGGAVGAQRANETQDRDVVLPAGTTVTITLNESLTVS